MHEMAVRDLFEQAHPEMAHMTRELIAIELESEFDRIVEKAAYDGEIAVSILIRVVFCDTYIYTNVFV